MAWLSLCASGLRNDRVSTKRRDSLQFISIINVVCKYSLGGCHYLADQRRLCEATVVMPLTFPFITLHLTMTPKPKRCTIPPRGSRIGNENAQQGAAVAPRACRYLKNSRKLHEGSVKQPWWHRGHCSSNNFRPSKVQKMTKYSTSLTRKNIQTTPPPDDTISPLANCFTQLPHLRVRDSSHPQRPAL